MNHTDSEIITSFLEEFPNTTWSCTSDRALIMKSIIFLDKERCLLKLWGEHLVSGEWKLDVKNQLIDIVDHGFEKSPTQSLKFKISKVSNDAFRLEDWRGESAIYKIESEMKVQDNILKSYGS